MLNNLINICGNIRCKNIIAPQGLECLIKKPVLDKIYNITIFPNFYRDKIEIDLKINSTELFYFRYIKKHHLMRLSILREEIFSNIPRYSANPNDLFIHIRSGDIFIDHISKFYSQPPLCFYQKILNEYRFNNIFLISNGHENPVVDALLKLYPNIKFINDSIENDISKIVNAYNLVMSRSTFIQNLIIFNNNLKNLYVYEILGHINIINRNLTIYRMEPSLKYAKIMKLKWNNTKEQLNLMLREDCINSKLTAF